jgi:hypothetical protein
VHEIGQHDEDLFYTNENGIYRSSDAGKTWELILPSKGVVYELTFGGNTLLAVMANIGC